MTYPKARKNGSHDPHADARGLCEICSRPNPGPAASGHQQTHCPGCGRELDLGPGGILPPEDAVRR